MATVTTTPQIRRSKGVNRREMMKFHILALVSTSVAATHAGAVEASTPIQERFTQWMAAHAALQHAFAGMGDDVMDALHNREIQLADEMMWMEAKTPTDTLRKLLAYTAFGETEPRDGALGHMLYGEAAHWVEGMAL